MATMLEAMRLHEVKIPPGMKMVFGRIVKVGKAAFSDTEPHWTALHAKGKNGEWKPVTKGRSGQGNDVLSRTSDYTPGAKSWTTTTRYKDPSPLERAAAVLRRVLIGQ